MPVETMSAPPTTWSPPNPSSVIGTPQQDVFWETVICGKGHIVLMARAGTGKTFSVVEAAKRALQKWPNLRVGFSAFNAHIAKELKSKVPRGCQAFTLHSLGLQAITAHLGRRPNIDDGKVRAILDRMAAPEDLNKGRVDRALVKACNSLVSLCKAYLYEGTPAQLDEILSRHDVDLSPDSAVTPTGKPRSVFTNATLKPRVYQLVPFLLEAAKTTLSVIDYDDMIWLPVVLGLKVTTYDLLFIDEAQDMNRCQQKLAFMVCPRGRIVIVGDPAQSIYAFRGADVLSMPRMTELLETSVRGCVTLPLTFTRRCPKAVVTLAQAIVPDIEALPDAPEGIVETITEKDFSQVARAGDMVLCRTNAPLVKAAHQFLRAGRKAVLRGKDLSGQIRDLIEGMGAQTLEELGDMLMRYRLAEGERLESAGKSAQVITAHEDRCDTLTVLMEGCSSLPELDAKISRIFDKKDENGAIILSSVHGSKGLEADTVYILRPDLMPHPKAERKEDQEQESNIRYVALTRAKNRLVFVESEAAKEAVEAFIEKGLKEIFDKHHGDDMGQLNEDDDEDEPESESTYFPDDDSKELPWREGFDSINWLQVHKARLTELERTTPFDAPPEYIEALEKAKAVLPRC
ncbi:ATP-dependent helicase [bacterium]|nr:MAG: ATP-dependent helicase [bacterium]